jgi:hypothetical protein
LGQSFFHKNRKIAGAVVLPTPGQNYIGCGLSQKKTEELKDLIQAVEKAKTELDAAQQKNASKEDIASLEKTLREAQARKDSFVAHWAAMGFCFANFLNIFMCFTKQKKWHRASWLPLDRASIAEIGASYSKSASHLQGRTSYLITGDSLATVDPTTGLGCTTAIRTVDHFHTFLAGLNNKTKREELHKDYDESCNSVVLHNMNESREMRELYRPDAVVV